MILRVTHPPNYLPERRYILDVLLGEFLGLDYCREPGPGADVRVTLASDPYGRRLILPDVLFQTPQSAWLTDDALPQQPLPEWTIPDALADALVVARQLPVIYGQPVAGRPGCYYEESEVDTRIGLDIFGSAFFMLTRYEELIESERDEHGRFPAYASLAYQEGFLKRALVNEYLEVLWTVIRRTWPNLQRRPREYRVLTSHDVDVPLFTLGTTPYRVLRSALADAILRKDRSLAQRRMRAYVESRGGLYDSDPNNTFEFIMDSAEAHGWQSSFNFVCGDSPNDPGRYVIDHPWIRRLLREIHERGHIVGVHPSYDTYRDEQRTKQEFQTLVSVAAAEGIHQDEWGGRQHYLRWENPTTWQNWEAAGLAYDSTLAFAAEPGFRCGTCYEYPAYNLVTRRPLDLRERPLVVMESAVFESMFHLDREDTDEIVKLAGVCSEFGGDMTLLWHNSSLISKHQRSLYRTVCARL